MGTPVDQLQAIRRIRDYAVALSLAPHPLNREDAEGFISTRQVTERCANDAAHAEQKRQLKAREADLSREILVLEVASGGAEPDNRLDELRLQRAKVIAEMNSLRAAGFSLRDDYEAKLAESELQRLDVEEREAVERVTNARLALQKSRIDNWRDAGSIREKQR